MSMENWVVVATMVVYLLFMLWVGRKASHRVSDAIAAVVFVRMGMQEMPDAPAEGETRG